MIAARQEKVLVFTQFREIDGAAGGVPRRRCSAGPASSCTARPRSRSARTWCAQFQEDESVAVLRALAQGRRRRASTSPPRRTSIHFDRWWNPAVENQATDRAFRIGQTKNVLVHKFVCRGTVEEKIDELIESKRQLAGDLLGGGAEMLLTEMNDDELLKLVALDLDAAMKEADR